MGKGNERKEILLKLAFSYLSFFLLSHHTLFIPLRLTTPSKWLPLYQLWVSV